MDIRSKHERLDTAGLNDLIRTIIGGSSLKDQVRGISLEADTDDEGAEFLRVRLDVEDAIKLPQADLMALLEAIEDGVLEQDYRYPSVRFSEAA